MYAYFMLQISKNNNNIFYVCSSKLKPILLFSVKVNFQLTHSIAHLSTEILIILEKLNLVVFATIIRNRFLNNRLLSACRFIMPYLSPYHKDASVLWLLVLFHHSSNPLKSLQKLKRLFSTIYY